MPNPYRGRPEYTFWKEGVTRQAESGVDPIVRGAFKIRRQDRIATAGSCFAQHISQTIVTKGYRYFVTEKFHGAAGTEDENYGIFPARFGNIYTARQLLQLIERAYGTRNTDE